MVKAYDFCKTVVDKNTTLDFLKYYSKKKYFFSLKLIVFFVIGRLLLNCNIISSSTYTKIRVLCLIGEPLNKIKSASKEYSKYLRGFLLHNVNEKLLCEARNKKVYVISNTLDFILEDFYRGENINLLASSLKSYRGFCSGLYNVYMLDKGKLNAFKSKENDKIYEYWTDDLEADVDICRESEIVYFVSKEGVRKL